jgi:hypothetical protein
VTSTAPWAPDCDAFACVGLIRCDYCGKLLPGPDTDVVLLAASRLRTGDAYGALRSLQAHARATS